MNFKKINLIIVAVLLLFNFLVVDFCYAGTFSEIMKGFHKTGQEAGYGPTGEGKPPKEFIYVWIDYINALAALIGLLFMIIILYGGYLWLTAQGNEEQVKKAKNLIIQATIALGVILAARILVELVIDALSKTIP